MKKSEIENIPDQDANPFLKIKGIGKIDNANKWEKEENKLENTDNK